MHFNKTRIAPTPSGYLHLGNAYSFALTAQLAKQYSAKILLRIDDLDRRRVNDVYVQDVFDTLSFLNIKYDEGPRGLPEYERKWSQMHRMNSYQSLLDQLHDEKLVYACICSRTQIQNCTCRDKNIPLDTPEANWRLFTNTNQIVRFKTLNDGIIETTLPDEMHDFVVRKKDGYPAYQLASVADDLYFGVDLIVRGQDLWASTIVQCYLAQVLGKTGFQNITFHHHPLVMEGDNKLSKSAGATSIKYLREQGKTLEQVCKMLPQV